MRYTISNREEMKLIILDFDGTLADTRHNIILTFQMTMRQLGLEMKSEEECAATIGLTLQDAFHALYPHFTPEDYTRLTETYRRIFAENRKLFVPQLFPGVKETLNRLLERGCTLAIASSRLSPSLHSFIEEMGIAHLFSHVVGGDNVENPKPASDAVLQTMESLGFSPDETIVVGDMPFDILMAKNAGVRSCGVTYGNSNATELKQCGADWVIEHFPLLLDLK